MAGLADPAIGFRCRRHPARDQRRAGSKDAAGQARQRRRNTGRSTGVAGYFQTPNRSVLEVSAAGQSDWLDQNIPKLLDPMTTMAEVRSKIAGKLEPNANGLPPFPLRPEPNLTWPVLEDPRSVIHPRRRPSAVIPGTLRVPRSSRPTATVMAGVRSFDSEIIYPATPYAPGFRKLGPLPSTSGSALTGIMHSCCSGCGRGAVASWTRGVQLILPSIIHSAIPRPMGALGHRPYALTSRQIEIAMDRETPGRVGLLASTWLAVSVLPTKDQEPMLTASRSFAAMSGRRGVDRGICPPCGKVKSGLPSICGIASRIWVAVLKGDRCRTDSVRQLQRRNRSDAT